MNALMQNYKAIGIALAVVVVALLSSVVIVPETHQGVVVQARKYSSLSDRLNLAISVFVLTSL